MKTLYAVGIAGIVIALGTGLMIYAWTVRNTDIAPLASNVPPLTTMGVPSAQVSPLMENEQLLVPANQTPVVAVPTEPVYETGSTCDTRGDCAAGQFCELDYRQVVPLVESCVRIPNDGSAGTYSCPELPAGQCVTPTLDLLRGYSGWTINSEGHLEFIPGE